MYRRFSVIGLLIGLILISCDNTKSRKDTDLSGVSDIRFVENKGGKAIAYSQESGIGIMEEDGYAFKDLNANGKLDTYEDWRLSYEDRARDLASQLSLEEIAGLMLYSPHQSIPARTSGYFAGTYNGIAYKEGETDPWALTDQQIDFIKNDNVRHVLLTSVESPEIAAKWNNNIQALCEGMGFGIPANNSSDPRHGSDASAEYNAAAGGDISMWPSQLGLAATFSPEIVKRFGEVAATEYRNLGLTTALSPQIGAATEPRWVRFNGSFGESPKLSAALARAYIDGFQGEAWGSQSVNAMVKHWPGGGTPEGGREPHYAIGKYGVYPGDNFEGHLEPFVEGAFKLDGGTQMASAIMPSYNISWNRTSENVASNFNREIIKDILIDRYGFEGVICTDWNVTHDSESLDSFVGGKPWGVEDLSVVERHYKALMAGVDQFGGNDDMRPILEAYQMGVEEHGESWMRERMERSAYKLLLNIFRTGLFENPYLDPETTRETVGSRKFMKEGFDAQLKSIVLLKNEAHILPIEEKKKVYIPKRHVAESTDFLGAKVPESYDYPINIDLVQNYYEVVEDPEQADFAIVYIESPKIGLGYSEEDVEKGGNGYLPISLQYGDYRATEARSTSLAGGDPREASDNRSYKDKTVETFNKTDAELVQETKAKMGDKPLILLINTKGPFVPAEIEPYSSVMMLGFEIQDQAFLEMIKGNAEPGARLPMQMPKDMGTVERQKEDVPFDMDCYEDSEGHIYDFGFGLNWKGKIKPDINEYK